MIRVNGTWMPSSSAETQFEQKPSVYAKDIDPKGGYQISRLERALNSCSDWRTAVDIGAHVGIWTRVLAERFSDVVAIEPLPDHIECFRHNVPHPNVRLVVAAAGERNGATMLNASPRMTVRVGGREGFMEAPVVCLDGLGLQNVDFLKIDVEGYEVAVLRGASETIRRCKPVVIVEQKPSCTVRYGFRSREAVTLLSDMGAMYLWSEGADHCFSWPR